MRKRICFIVSEILTASVFLKDHIDKLSEEFDVYLVANISDHQLPILKILKIAGFKSIQIKREINILSDLKAVFALRKYINSIGFYALHSVTPKAGLISALAGALSKVPNRIHIFTGQVWATRKGSMRCMLMTLDWLIGQLNTRILVDGESQRKFLIRHRIIKEHNSLVIGDGSISGVNTDRFNPCNEVREKIRTELRLAEEQVVFVFLGRINRDKGIGELFQAFNRLARENGHAFLLLVGIDEENFISKVPAHSAIKPGVNFHFYGKTSHPEEILQAGDVFCLPTYREGFGTSVIEASCLGLPVICSDTYGVLDAMVDDVTGLRCKVQDAESLYQNMKRLSEDPELRHLLGKNGRHRVLSKFSGEVVTNAWMEYYRNL